MVTVCTFPLNPARVVSWHIARVSTSALQTQRACGAQYIKPVVLLCLCGCEAVSLQSRAHSIPDKCAAFIIRCCESQMRVRPCSVIYHPWSASSRRGRKDLGCVYTLSRRLFLKPTRFSVTVISCFLLLGKQTSTRWLCLCRVGRLLTRNKTRRLKVE